MMNVEKRIRNLETLLNSLKASFPTVGSNVKFYIQTSQEFTKEVPARQSETVRIKFTPDYGLGKSNIISLRPIISLSGSGLYSRSETEIQDGSGEVVIKIRLTAGLTNANFKIAVVASGSLPGTFSMI